MAPAACLLLLFALTVSGCRRAEPATTTQGTDAPSSDGLPAAERSGVAVEAEMRNVALHIDSGIVLQIVRLRGQLLRSLPAVPPALDDKQSFILSVHSAQIAIDTASLSTLLNRHVFGYPGSPLRNLRITTAGGQLIQRGVMRAGVRIRFTIRSAVSLTPDGQIRLHPTSVKVVGFQVNGLMKSLGVHLDQMVKLRPGHGVRIEGDDFILDPTGILPPPAILGRLTGIKVEEGQLSQTFGPADSAAARPLRRLDPAVPNYMYFQHGTLRFGRLTMTDADLEIDDADPGDPLDFSLDHYNDQLVAGYSTSTTDHGLIVHMPDLGTFRPKVAPVRLGRVAH